MVKEMSNAPLEVHLSIMWLEQINLKHEVTPFFLVRFFFFNEEVETTKEKEKKEMIPTYSPTTPSLKKRKGTYHIHIKAHCII